MVIRLSKIIPAAYLLSMSALGYGNSQIERYQSLKHEHQRALEEKTQKILVKNTSEGLSRSFEDVNHLMEENRSFVDNYTDQLTKALNKDRALVNELIAWSKTIMPRFSATKVGTPEFVEANAQIFAEYDQYSAKCRRRAAKQLVDRFNSYAKTISSKAKSIHERVGSLKNNPYVDSDFLANMLDSSQDLTSYSKNIWQARNKTLRFAAAPKACANLVGLKELLEHARSLSDAITSLNLENLSELRDQLAIFLKIVDSREEAFKLKEAAVLLIRSLETSFTVNLDQSRFEDMVADRENVPVVTKTVNNILENEHLNEDDKDLIIGELNASRERISQKYIDLADDPSALRIKVYRRLKYLGLDIRKLASATYLTPSQKDDILNRAKALGIYKTGQVKPPPSFTSFSEVVRFSKKIGAIEAMIGEQS
jgi:hypothetical protein